MNLPFSSFTSIKHKLVIIIVLISMISLILGLSASVSYNIISMEDFFIKSVTTTTEMVGNRSSVALLFNDETLAYENLASFKANPAIHMACTYNNDGSLLAKYSAEGQSFFSCPIKLSTAIAITDNYLEFSTPILDEDSMEPLGMIFVKASLADIDEFILNEILFSGLIALIVILIAVVAVSKISHNMSQSVISLANLSSTVAKGEFDIDIDKSLYSNDEIGQLAQSFQDMLEGLKTTTVSKSFMDNVIQSMADLLIVVKTDFTIQTVNHACLDKLSYSEDHLLRQPVYKIFPLEDLKQKLGWDFDNTASFNTIDAPPSLELSCIAQDGTHIPVYMSWAVMRDSDGLAEGIVIVAKDISDRIEYENQLHEAKEQAENANQAKSEFLANMSHEIRTPMNGIIGMTSLLLGTDLSPKQRNFTQTIERSSDNLLELINDILDYSKIESGKFELELLPFDFQKPLEELVDLLSPKAHEKGIELLLRFKPGIPRNVIGDPKRVRQIIYNLAGNAIKFTSKGHVLIDVDIDSQTDSHVMYKISIIDTGIGIPLDKQDYIFSKFTQADTSTTRNFGGTGLGLAISKQLSELMGGEIGVISKEGEGSVFWFTLNLSIDVLQPLSETPDKAELRNARVLIVDDNAVNRSIIFETLNSWGVDVHSVDSGEEALERLTEAHLNENPFKMVISDYMMPAMDGLQLGHYIKENPLLHDTHLIIITSCERKGDTERFFEAGFAGYLVKPVHNNYLMQIMQVLLSPNNVKFKNRILTKHTLLESDENEGTFYDDEHIFDSVHILLTEDNLTNQQVSAAILENFGCTVTTADNGKEAVDLVEVEDFDLVFMDCQMPVMDGYEAATHIKAKHPNLPIIAFTAHAMKGDKEKCLAHGMDDYISKPIRKGDLEYKLLKWLPDDKTEQDDSPYQNMPQTSQSVESNRSDDTLILDERIFEDLKETVGNRLSKVLEDYLTTSHNLLHEIDVAIEENNFQRLYKAAHPLKSSSMHVGAMQLAKLADILESFDSSKSIKAAEPYVTEAKDIFERVRKKIGE